MMITVNVSRLLTTQISADCVYCTWIHVVDKLLVIISYVHLHNI